MVLFWTGLFCICASGLLSLVRNTAMYPGTEHSQWADNCTINNYLTLINYQPERVLSGDTDNSVVSHGPAVQASSMNTWHWNIFYIDGIFWGNNFPTLNSSPVLLVEFSMLILSVMGSSSLSCCSVEVRSAPVAGFNSLMSCILETRGGVLASVSRRSEVGVTMSDSRTAVPRHRPTHGSTPR